MIGRVARRLTNASSSVAAGSSESPVSTHGDSGKSAGQGDDGLAQWARWPNLTERLTCNERGIE